MRERKTRDKGEKDEKSEAIKQNKLRREER